MPVEPNELVVVVIVNFRTPELTIDCLRSLATERDSGENLRVNLVEGGSGDDSAAILSRAITENGWSSWVELIVSPRNGGFAYANNLGICAALERGAGPSAIWLLNSDTYLLPGALAPLRAVLEKCPDVGMVGSRLVYPDGQPQYSAFRFPTVWSEVLDGARSAFLGRLLVSKSVLLPLSEDLVEVEWIAGASMLIRCEVFSSIGYLDDNYFMYYEETDFCRRALNASWKTMYEPRSRVVHLVGQSSGVTGEQETKKRRPAYWFESRHRYFLTHFGAMLTLVADFGWLFWRACWHVRQWFRINKRSPGTPHLWKDFLRHSVLFKGFSLPAFTDNANAAEERALLILGATAGSRIETRAEAVTQA